MNTRAPTVKLLVLVWAALLVLLFVTWGVAELDLGRWGIVAAMTIAVVKMLLVVLIFMHVRYSSSLTWVFAMAGMFWFSIMIALTMSDYLTRSGAFW
ncbi:MAG TPA: cytochrome C oxidase subunit IV family protein [Verrucomicrobiae bacterium]|nr:cytochrome C oxidase subunit IV family protein [Verrucomicrobiae bacterium]